MVATAPSAPARPKRRTELATYPSGATRYLCLGIVVLATIVLYYQFYLAGAVAAGTGGKNGILTDYHMSFTYYVNIAVAGYILGAVASFVSGIADKYGRVNIITGGLFVVALLCLLGIPLAHSKVGFAIVFAAIGLVEGVILVATPALIRDFSPQLGRASAMGFWTLGPVLGSLVVSIQISNTSTSTPWHDQYIASGIVGLVVAVLSLLFLKELTPGMRDQLMVSARDRALIEARAAGIDVEASLKRPFRQMLKPDIVLSAFAISVFLIIYYVAVGFFPVYFQTIFGFSQSKANALGNWIWAFDAGALLVIGYLSDKIRVRKPFMVVGAVGAIVMTIIFAMKATHPGTSYGSFALILSLLAIFLGVAYAPWMASFTETVEKRNPALTATGLAVWGLVIRLVIAVSVFIVPHVVNTVSTLVEKGPAVSAAQADANVRAPGLVAALQKNPTVGPTAAKYGAQYGAQLATAAKIDSATAAALTANPTDAAAQVKALTELSGVPANEVATLAAVSKVDAATLAALTANPADQAAGIKAVSEITGVSVADVTTIATLNAEHGPALAAAQAVDTATITTLLTDPTNTAALQKAVGEIVSKLGITQADAGARLQELKTIPVTQLLLLQSSGVDVTKAEAALKSAASVPAADAAKVVAAGAQLKAVGTIPAAVTTFFTKTGPAAIGAKNFAALTDTTNTKLQADLAVLGSSTGTQVAKAAHDSPKQWRNYFWIAVGGEVVFIPLIFLLTGFWSPKKARQKEEEHEAWVEAELAKLGQSA
ncbi:MFS transporter [Jatrophihabitans sp.]|uniref:MFS transporter n=1 Tax=Jatrophihabitans sp. TaxID=1932789 RepID=UPI0030C6B38D|nr:major facilitator superfamily 1 [Jatrophihabitans sp.]